MKLMTVGPCPVCNVNIWKQKELPLFQFSKEGLKINFKKKVPYEIDENGMHFWILETTGSRMQVAICKRCHSNINNLMVKKIHDDIIYTKLEKIKHLKDKERQYKLFNRIRTIEVWRYADTEQEIIEYLKEKNG